MEGGKAVIETDETDTNTIAMDGVPGHLRAGLARYLRHGIRPGNFLTAVLENNLEGAIQYGDEDSLAGLAGTVRWLHNNVPQGAWGTPAKVKAWCGNAEFRESILRICLW